jgi:hypothetical protein
VRSQRVRPKHTVLGPCTCKWKTLGWSEPTQFVCAPRASRVPMSRGTHASRLTSEGMAFQGKMVGANQKASVNASLSRSQVRPPPPPGGRCQGWSKAATNATAVYLRGGSHAQKTLLSTHLSAGAQAVAPNWERYNAYQPGKPGVAGGATAGRKKDKPVVYRGEHGLPYITTDGAQVPPDDYGYGYEEDELALVTLDASGHELVDANDLADPVLAGGPNRPQVRSFYVEVYSDRFPSGVFERRFG